MLSFVVTPAELYKNTTKGLLGTWNDDPGDDFTLPDGTVLPSSSTLRQIHFGFGVKCKQISDDYLLDDFLSLSNDKSPSSPKERPLKKYQY